MLRLLILLALVATLVNFKLMAEASDSAIAGISASGSGDIWLAILITILMKPVLARIFER